MKLHEIVGKAAIYSHNNRKVKFYSVFYANKCSHECGQAEDMQKAPMRKRFCFHKSWQSTIFQFCSFSLFSWYTFNFFPLKGYKRLYFYSRFINHFKKYNSWTDFFKIVMLLSVFRQSCTIFKKSTSARL